MALLNETRGAKHGLGEHFRMKRNREMSILPPAQGQSPANAASITFSAALEKLVRLQESADRSAIMTDINQIIGSYKGLNITEPNDTRAQHPYNDGYHTSGDSNQSDWDREDIQRSTNSSPIDPYGPYANTNQPGYVVHTHTKQHIQSPTTHSENYPRARPQTQLQALFHPSEWPCVSATSSIYSDSASAHQQSSSSSQFSSMQPASNAPRQSPRSEHARFSPTAMKPSASCHDYTDDLRGLYPSSPRYAMSDETYVPPVAPRTSNRAVDLPSVLLQAAPHGDAWVNSRSRLHGDSVQPLHTPWPGSSREASPVRRPDSPAHGYTGIDEVGGDTSYEQALRYQHDTAPRGRAGSSVHIIQALKTTPSPCAMEIAGTTPALRSAPSKSSLRNLNPRSPHPVLSNAASHPNLRNLSSAASHPSLRNLRLRRPSIAPSTAPTTRSAPHPSSSPPLPLPSPSTASRPCKANHYWGFCKGAWTTRENPSKGLVLRTQPAGYYNSKQSWNCTRCAFAGPVFRAAPSSPTTKMAAAAAAVWDPRVHASLAGIRYRWLFLAKSHVKMKGDGSGGGAAQFGCIVCCAEGRAATCVYAGVEALMNHIALVHACGMSESTRAQVRCVVGRVAGPEEAWDLNVPVFDFGQGEGGLRWDGD